MVLVGLKNEIIQEASLSVSQISDQLLEFLCNRLRLQKWRFISRFIQIFELALAKSRLSSYLSQ